MRLRKKYIPYILIAFASLLVFCREFGSGDELWNYAFAQNIADGLLPYRDFNIVQTPLSAYFPALFIKIFGGGLISYRIAGYILFFNIFSLFYYVCRVKSGSSLVTVIATAFVMGLQFFPYVYNYNYLNVAVILFIFFLYIKVKNSDTVVFNAVIGLLIGLTPLIKQNTGFFFILAEGFICLTELILKKKKINILARLSASVVPSLIFITVIFINGTAGDFFEYAVEGITTFSHRYTLYDLAVNVPFSFLLFLLFTTMTVISVIRMIKTGNFHRDYRMLFLTVASFSVVYPLCDSVHLFCAFITMTPFAVSFVKPRTYKRAEIYICCFVSFAVAAVSVVAYIPIGDEYMLSDIDCYRGIVSTEKINTVIKNVGNYILESEKDGYAVRIADDSAAAYLIPLDMYEKNWSMLLVGNIGNSTVEELLCTDRECRYLVFKNTENLSVQNHFELIDYIKSNYRCVGEIEWFDVYEKND